MKKLIGLTIILILSFTLKTFAGDVVMKDEQIANSSNLLLGTKMCKNGDKVYYLATDRKIVLRRFIFT